MVLASGLLILLGLIGRLIGINSSLWLDEFGTLWCVSSTAIETFHRATAFQGQTPFYYLLAWCWYWLLGASEAALRFQSIVAWLAFVGLLIGVCNRLSTLSVMLTASLVGTLSVTTFVYSGTARPYMTALGLMMCSLYSVERLRSSAALRHAVIGGLAGGLTVLSHYLVGFGFAGLLLYLLVTPHARGRAGIGSLLTLCAIAGAVSLVGLKQFVDLTNRTAGLEWLDSPDVLLCFALFVPLAPAIACGLWTSELSWTRHGHMFSSLLFPIVAVSLAYATGINLVHPRYLLGSFPAAAVLTVLAIRGPGRLARIALLIFIVPNLLALGWAWRLSGTLTLVNVQDWRGAVDVTDHVVGAFPNAVVLYRSGFVEQDVAPLGQIRSADLSPLRSPGRKLVRANIVPLTFRWEVPGRASYFEGIRGRIVRPGETLIYLSPIAGGQSYLSNFRAWLRMVAPDARIEDFHVRGVYLSVIRIPADLHSDGAP